MVGVFAPLVFASCSLKVRVEEKWEPSFHKAIPLSQAARTWQDLRAGRSPSPSELATYNAAVRKAVVQVATNWAEGEDRIATLTTDLGETDLRADAEDTRSLAKATEIVPADFVKVRGALNTLSSVEGIGAPLIVRQPRCEDDPMIPETGLWVPYTALLNLDQPQAPVLELVNPITHQNLNLGGKLFPLSANYTAAFARDFQDRQRQFENLSALLRFERYADRTGLYRVTHFDPGKEPCIFIHGINSSPMTWGEPLNRLYGDAEIRARYEFWTFAYPTGATIPYMAAELRRAIREMLTYRAAHGARDQRITLVGHSMGGLLAKAMTFSSGDREWFELFQVPIDELDISDQRRETLRRMIYFDPIPEIHRVVFCAVPHRGSRIVEQPGAKLLGDLVEVPSQLLALSSEIVARSAYALTPTGMEFARDRLTSIDQLSSKAWTTAEFLNKPLNPAVTYHSIIGNNRLPVVPLEKSGDGIVPYLSAHLEGVASELVVRPSGHGVHRTDEGISEIRRILRLP